MAKKKTKKKTNKKQKKEASNMDLAVVAIIILSILLCVLIYGNSGIVGVKLRNIRWNDGNYKIHSTNWDIFNRNKIGIR